MSRLTRARRYLRSTPVYPTYTRMKYRLSSRARSELFAGFFRDNIWGSQDSASGSGSTLHATREIRQALPALLNQLGVTSLLDVPCGDFAWMQYVDLGGIDYVGADIVPELVANLQRRYGGPGRRFIQLDLCCDAIPDVEAIFVRDLLLHLPNSLVRKVLQNVRNSSATWLIASHYPFTTENTDVRLGSHRFLNLTKPPFALPEPHTLVADADVDRPDKSLGVWSTFELP